MGVLDYRDKIRAMVEQQPVQPTVVAKELHINSMLTSAMLSEMAEKGLLKVSSLKVGSSPLYYHPEHPEHVLNYVQHLNDKDRKTVSLLQEQGVLRDTALDPLTRVSLRAVKDFALPLDVTIDGTKELFWKFYLLTDEQAAERIKQIMQPQPKTEAPASEQLLAKPARQRRQRAKKVQEAPLVGPQAPELQQSLTAEQPLQQPPTDDAFLQQVLSFFAANNIIVLEQMVIKKKSEYDFVIQLASPVGQLHYYCKAKNKAKVGEADLSHAFVQGQLKKLPVLFLAPGSLTKPAQDLAKELKGITVKQV